MSETASAAIIREKWNDTTQKRTISWDRKFSWHSPVIQAFIESDYLDGGRIRNVLSDYIGDKPIHRGLEIGGGLGGQANEFYTSLNVDRFDVLDISDVAVASGNKKAREQGRNIHFSVCDLNNDPLPDGPFDLICARGALHHIENLEFVFAQIADRLTDDGVFFANDYMGPSYMQWTGKQLDLMNAIVQLLPNEMNRVQHKGNQVIREVRPIPLDIFARVDPSEGVRAAEIFDVMAQHLTVKKVIPFGQTLAYETLRGRVQNFDDYDEKDRTILSLICLLEKELITAGAIQSDFNFVIAAKPKDSR
ncbi:MAG: class I SAM-dependent methyltransferase [Pseudomonadota bacterium]